MKAIPTTADGQHLREIDHYEDGGGRVPDRIVERAGIIGAIRLLEEIAANDDNQHFRREARSQAEALKHLVRRRFGHEVISNEEILGPGFLESVRRKRIAGSPALPMLTIENGSDS